MRVSLKVVGLGLAIAAAGGFLALRSNPAEGGIAPGLTDWSGKVAFKDYSTDSGQKVGHGAFPATMNVNQSGANVYIQLAIESEQGIQQFSLSGNVGNGNFWAFNGNSAAPLVLSGHVTGSGSKQKMKCTGVFVDGSDINELKLSLNRQTGL